MRTKPASTPRVLHFMLGLLALFLVLAVGAFFGLRSGPSRSRIGSALSRVMGLPVAIGELRASFFPSPVIHVGSIQIGGADSTAAPGVFVGAVNIVPQLSSMLPGRTLTADDVYLSDLTISVRRDSTGHWLLPVPPLPSPWESVGATARRRTFDLKQVRVRDGAVRIVDELRLRPNGSPTVTTIRGVEADGELMGGKVKVSRFSGHHGEALVTGTTDPIGSQQFEWKVERRLLELVLELEAQAAKQDSDAAQYPSVTPATNREAVGVPKTLNDRMNATFDEAHLAVDRRVTATAGSQSKPKCQPRVRASECL